MKKLLTTVAIISSIVMGTAIAQESLPTPTDLGSCDSPWVLEKLRTVQTRDMYGVITTIFDVTPITGVKNEDGTLNCLGFAYTSFGIQHIKYDVFWTDPEHNHWYINVNLVP